ncbi:MAG: VWA domain-containing protein [Acidobacteriota bacterium]|nr:MAG: VWA domain-containing protein [Acidobacteriota bacterium]
MRLLRLLPAIIFLVTSTSFLSAQDDDPIKVESSIVRLNVGVVDRRGRPITDLTPNRFSIFEDDVEQQILRFEPADTPFSVVIMLDMSGSTLSFRQLIRMSASRFVDALSPSDRVAVIEFYDKVNLRNDFTTNRSTIFNSINVANGRGKTHLYRALDLALEKLEKEKNRRKAIIVLTDGVDTIARDADREALETLPDGSVPGSLKPDTNLELIRILNRSDAIGATIYPLALPTGDPGKLADPTPRQVEMYSAARKRLELLAQRSGGTINAINRLEEMSRLYAEVAADLKTLYTIEYSPSNGRRDGKWRSIRITIDDDELLPRTRLGYFAR